MNLLLHVLLLFQVATTHVVTLNWNPFEKPTSYSGAVDIGSTPTNPGWYNIYRSVQSNGSCGVPTWIGHTQQTYASGYPVLPQYIDVSAAPAGSYCYQVSFIFTLPGTATAVESDLSVPLPVGPIP